MDSLKGQARRAGLLYLVGGITAPFSLLVLPRMLMVPGDATATAARVRASATLLRLGIASELLAATVFIFVALALYDLFKRVDEKQALAMLVLFLVSVPISLLNVVNSVAALMFANGAGFLSVFERPQLDALSMMFLRLHGQGIFLAEIFWGLWLFPFGALVIRSTFVPRALGVFLMAAGCGYVANAITALVLPTLAHAVLPFATVLTIGELPIIFWLVIWGARARRIGAPASVAS